MNNFKLSYGKDLSENDRFYDARRRGQVQPNLDVVKNKLISQKVHIKSHLLGGQ